MNFTLSEQKMYPMFLHGHGRSYGVTFPDFPGCVSHGSGIRSAIDNGKQALQLHFEGMEQEGLAIPEPSCPEHVLLAANACDELPIIVLVPIFCVIVKHEMPLTK